MKFLFEGIQRLEQRHAQARAREAARAAREDGLPTLQTRIPMAGYIDCPQFWSGIDSSGSYHSFMLVAGFWLRLCDGELAPQQLRIGPDVPTCLVCRQQRQAREQEWLERGGQWAE